MVGIRHGLCVVKGCLKHPQYGNPLTKFRNGIPKRCYKHSLSSDINLLPIMCMMCGIRIGTHGKKGTKSTTYCSKCAPSVRLTVDNTSLKLMEYILDKIQEGKENKVRKVIDHFKLIDEITEQSIDEIPGNVSEGNIMSMEIDIRMAFFDKIERKLSKDNNEERSLPNSH